MNFHMASRPTSYPKMLSTVLLLYAAEKLT
nr:MAG TPA: hypothetical protein [Caudoviricetes sp.]